MSLDEIGPYRIERLVGRGGMGRVFEGRHWDTEERVAVKLLAPALQDESSFRDRFEAEIETLKQLDHPNIVRLIGYGEQDGQLFYAMEFVEGRTLQMEIADKRHFTWKEVVQIGIQICAALKHAHDRGIVHRDLKPANLLWTESQQVKLTDFGIAKLFGAAHLTVDGGVIGTADYMSPEQAESRAATTLSDLYSLGGVLYALLAGRPPFAAKTVAECLHRLRYEVAAGIRRLAPDTPVELEVILDQLLEKDPQKRVPTAIALANRLKSLDFALSQRPAEEIEEPKLMSDQPTDPAEEKNVNHDGETRDATNFSRGTSSSAEIQPGGLVNFSSNVEFEADPEVAVEDPVSLPRNTHFTSISDERAKPAGLSGTDHGDLVATLARLAMIIVGFLAVGYFIYWFSTRPPSSDRLFDEIELAMRDPDKDAKLHVLDSAQSFLKQFPSDERTDKVKRYIKEIRGHRFRARMERVIKFRGDVDELEPIELDYLHAIRDIPTDPERSLKRLEALVRLYGETDGEDQLVIAGVRSAEEVIRQLKAKISQRRDRQLKSLRKQLAMAKKMMADNAVEAKRLLQAIIDLHGDSPWAAGVIREARQSLK